MRAILKKLNWNELGFDIAMVIMAAISFFVVFPSGIIPQAGDHTLLHQNLIVFAEFVFAFVLGKEGQHYLKGRLSTGKWRKYYYFIAVFYIISVAYIAIPIVLDAVGIFAYAVGFFACIMGFATGTGTWNEDSNIGRQIKARKEKTEERQKEKEEGKRKKRLSDYLWEKGFAVMIKDYPVLMGLPLLFLFYGMVFLFNAWAGFSGLMGVIAFLGIVIVPVIGMFVFGAIVLIISMLISKIRSLSRIADELLMKFFFPMLFALLFLVWNKVYLFYIIGEDTSFFRLVLLSLFLGLIPYRFLLMIRPPVNFLNIVFALMALAIYYVSYFIS
ncbi:MAG: hypothetical protein C0592_05670 [Marinilabiliales bacterium]|nr:MAG: hypothetical protein C0592_05670 [Marinilabiliales bacterium]